MHFKLLLSFININYSQIFALLLGELVNRVYIHNLSWNSEYLANIQSLEVKRNTPLLSHDPEFKGLNTEWMSEPGVHIGIRQARRQIVFMLRITYAKYYLHYCEQYLHI